MMIKMKNKIKEIVSYFLEKIRNTAAEKLRQEARIAKEERASSRNFFLDTWPTVKPT